MCGLSGGVCVARGGVGAEPRLAHRADERSSACGGVHASTPPRCLPVFVVWLGVSGVVMAVGMCGLSGLCVCGPRGRAGGAGSRSPGWSLPARPGGVTP